MTNLVRNLAVAAVLAAGISSVASVASAAPVADALAIKNAVPATVEIGAVAPPRMGRRGCGVGAGLVAGAIVGGALSSPYYGYGPGPYLLRTAAAPGLLRRAGRGLWRAASGLRRAAGGLRSAAGGLRRPRPTAAHPSPATPWPTAASGFAPMIREVERISASTAFGTLVPER